MRILLIRPPGIRFPGEVEPAAVLPIGCLYIAAVLEADNHEVSVLDCQVYMDEYPNWKWGGREMFGMPWEELQREINSSAPDLVGISNQFTAGIDSAIKVAEIVKQINPGIVTVVGGNHSSTLPSTFFELTKDIDIVCMCEGERRILDIICCIKGEKRLEDTKGIAFRKDGTVIINDHAPHLTPEELDALPFPAYHLVDMERYFRIQKKMYLARDHYEYPDSQRAVSMITSRGCPYNCTFCSIHLHMGKRFRAHSSHNVLDHIALLTGKYRVRHIYFEDDNLTQDKDRFEKILDGLIENNSGITWDTPNGVRAELSKELIAKSKKSGCIHLVIAVESGSQKNLDTIVKKKLDLQHVEQTAIACKDLGLDLSAFFIIGFPQETIEDMQTTLDYAINLERKYNVFPRLNLLKPLVGTEVYHEAKEKGLLSPSSPWSGLVKTDNFTQADVMKLAKAFYRKNKLLLLKKMGCFIIRYPRTLVRLTAALWSSPDRRKSLLIAMIHTNCLLRDFKGDQIES